MEQQTGLPTERQIQILHVEDEPDLHQVIRAMAGDQFLFETASTLAEARTRVASQHFDVVLLDLGLPDGSGWDLLPEVREQQPSARVVVLSGKDVSVEEACNVEAALLKSQISAEQLLEVINDRINPTARKHSDELIVTHSVRGG